MRTSPKWRRFEEDVAVLVEAFGYTASATPPSGDMGVDVIAHKNGRKIVLQCKLYGTGSIGGPVITGLAGAKQYFEADEAICITTSSYTKQAREIAQRTRVHLVDREKLKAICQEAGVTLPSVTMIEIGDERVPLDEGTLTIGRDASCDLVIDDPTVSRKHALMARLNNRLYVEDTRSTNGTKLNGRRLVAPESVCYDDVLSFGNFEAHIVLGVGTK